MKEIDSPQRIRVFALALAALLVVPVQFWISATWTGFSINSLFAHAVFIAFIVAGLNAALKRLSPRVTLRPGEMMVVYTVLAVATGASGHDTIEMLTQVIAFPAQFSNAENEWKELFHHLLPKWLFVWESDAVEHFYTQGHAEYFWTARTFQTLMKPIAFWSAFLIALYVGMLSINIILRKQWVERERLAFPVAQVPLGLVDTRSPILRSNYFWAGFALTAGLSLMNGLHRLYPWVPGPTYGKFSLGALFTEAPWNVIGDVYVEFLPFVIGLSFFIPVDLSFSIWFFYWFWKFVNVFGRIVGLHYLPGFPGYWTQGMGGMILLACTFLYWARRHIKDALQIAFRTVARRDPNDDSPYGFAVWGLMGSVLFLIGFLTVAGMSPWVAFLFLGSYYALSTVTTRLRAQLGPPTHELPFTASGMLTSFLGTKRIDVGSLTQMAVFRFVDFGQRGNPMPTMMESLYLKDRLHLRQPAMIVATMIVGIVLGTTIGFAGNIHRSYDAAVQTWVGTWSFPWLSGQIRLHSEGIDLVYIVYFIIGGGMVFLLSMMSRAFVWWPFHPLGYIMGGEWMLRHLWFPIFLAWAIRWTLLKFGGMNAHRKAIPFFLGVTVADATMLSLWSLYGELFNRWTLTYVYW